MGRPLVTGDAGGYDRERRIASLLRILGEETRGRIFLRLAEGEMYVGRLCVVLGKSQPLVSHHLAMLRHAGLVEARPVGKSVMYELTELGRKLAGMVDGLG